MTKLQTELVVSFVASYRDKYGISPTYEEIACQFDVTKGNICYHVQRALTKGLLIKRYNSPRSLRLPWEDISSASIEIMKEYPIVSALGRQTASPFARIGITTIEDLIAAIKTYGLRQSKNSQHLVMYKFADPDAPLLPHAGPVTWSITLAYLDSVGYNWREELIRPPKLRLNYKRQEQIADLKDRIYEITCQMETAMTILNSLLITSDAETNTKQEE